MKTLKSLKTLGGKLSAFTLVELLVVISIIAVLAALALPAITGALVKGKITQQVSNFRQLYLASHSAYMDGQVAGTNMGFPQYYTTITIWATNLAPAYIPSTNSFYQLLMVNGSNSTVYSVSESDASNNIMIAAGLISGQTNVSAGLPYNGKGAAVVTSQGQAISISGTNPILVGAALNGVGLSTNVTPLSN
jgi:prepilin-type N-terminal cleavage/methylation domain-containing protein